VASAGVLEDHRVVVGVDIALHSQSLRVGHQVGPAGGR
jgi:hypothetical protein